jgi:molecular chaperone DnaK (HSP70)
MLRTVGDTQFGGIDMDRLIADALSPPDTKLTRREILSECRRGREKLSSVPETTLHFGEVERRLTKVELDGIVASLYQKVVAFLDELFEGAPLTRDDINEVHIVGGLAHDPRFVSIVTESFPSSASITKAAADAVVIGSALEGAILTEISSPLIPKLTIRLTTPLSIGFSLADGTRSILIPRGSIIPFTSSATTTTSRDNQSNVGFDVVEGERTMAKDNVKLGNVVVRGIQQAPRGVPKINVTMTINTDGILVVEAVDVITGSTITATIQSNSNLSKDEVTDMVAEARAHKAEDDRLQKRSLWRARLVSYVDNLALMKVPEGPARDEFYQRIEEWHKWNADNSNAEAAAEYINQYFAVRKEAKRLLAALVKAAGEESGENG